MAKLTVRDLNVSGKRVFVRVDYNVPLEEKAGAMVITDATRIAETLPTLRLLIERGGKLILASHLGRPKGQREPAMSLRPVAARLAELLGCNVNFADDCIGEKVEQLANALPPGGILLLENVRYYKEEEANDPVFAEKLAKAADVFVNDAFGAAHRAHASTEGVARVVAKRGGQCAEGLLMERELKFLGEELEKPARPTAIRDLKIYRVLNSAGRFCVEVQIVLADGTSAAEPCPTGTTTGKYDSKSVSLEQAEALSEKLKAKLVGLCPDKQAEIDALLSETLGNPKGRSIAANLSAAASMAVCRVAAIAGRKPLYRHIMEVFGTQAGIPGLIVNVLNGGAHAPTGLPFTEFFVLGRDGGFPEVLEMIVEVHEALGSLIRQRYGPLGTLSGLEGGYAPCISGPQEALDLIEDAIEQSGCSEKLGLGIDVAASSLYQLESGKYAVGREALLPNGLVDFFKSIANTTQNLQYLEDPFAEDHTDQWVRLREALPKVMLAGDDLVSTESKRLSTMIERNAINAVVLKVNQCGTLTELVDCLHLAKKHSIKTIASHRSQETDSDFVTHLAVGLGADYLKAGACARERIVKYNSLLRIARLHKETASW